MSNSNVIELEGPAGSTGPLAELMRSGTRQLLQQAIEAEVEELLAANARLLEDGRASVVRNGHLPEREIQTGIGPGRDAAYDVQAGAVCAEELTPPARLQLSG